MQTRPSRGRSRHHQRGPVRSQRLERGEESAQSIVKTGYRGSQRGEPQYRDDGNESRQKCVLDEILARFLAKKPVQKLCHGL
jgi:hypothetical protein